MAKSKKPNKLQKTKTVSKPDNKVLRKLVSVDAPSGEGKQMQARTVMGHQAVLEALAEVRGHIKNACALAGIDRSTFYEYMRDPDFAQAVEHIKDGVTDDYIEALHQVGLEQKFFPAIKYYLDNHAQGRGYGKELNAPTNNPAGTTNIQINLSTLPVETLKQLKQAITTTKEK